MLNVPRLSGRPGKDSSEVFCGSWNSLLKRAARDSTKVIELTIRYQMISELPTFPIVGDPSEKCVTDQIITGRPLGTIQHFRGSDSPALER